MYEEEEEGKDWSVPSAVAQSIEAFTSLMCGYPKFVSINLVPTTMLKKMVEINKKLTSKSKAVLSRLLLYKDCLIPYIIRVNYRLASFKRANQPIHWSPKPYDSVQGWQKVNNVLQTECSCGAVLQFSSLVEIVDDI